MSLVENRRQARKVRWVCRGSLLWALACLLWATDLARTFGLSPGDGAVLRPAGERWVVASFVAAIGLLPVAGLVFYARRYVIRLVRSRQSAQVTLLGFGASFTREYGVAALGGSKTHEGRIFAGGVSVRAPWITIRINGKRYVVDLQSERVDQRALAALINDGARARSSEGRVTTECCEHL